MARDIKELKARYGTTDKVNSEKKFLNIKEGGQHSVKNVVKPKDGRNTIKRLLVYFFSHRLKLFTTFVMLIFSTLSTLIGSFMLFPIINKIAKVETNVENSGKIAVWADDILSSFQKTIQNLWQINFKNNDDILTYLLAALIFLVIIYLIGVITTYFQQKIMLYVTQSSLTKIRSDLFEKLQKLPVSYYDSNSTGDIMSRFTNDIDVIETMFNTALINIVSGIITVIVTFIFMISTNLILTIITVLFAPIMLKLSSLIANKSRRYYKEQQDALGVINGYIEETVSGQKVIKVFNHEDECQTEFNSLNLDLKEKQFKAGFFGGIMGPIIGNTSQISYGVTIGVGGILMATSALSPGALTVFAQYARRFSFPISNISQQMTTVFSALAGAEKVFNLMDSQSEPLDNDLARVDHIEGELTLKNVSFGYNPDILVLKNISLKVKKGQKIAFVGSTGAGKTTITNLVNRFYDIKQGEILIDNCSIFDYKKDYLRQNIATVLQDTQLFTGSVMENIRYGRLDASDEEVIEAAKTALAHSFIIKLDNGYQTILKGGGSNLSQGQKQLLNIARAALSKAPILVLDEATSSVDTRTEKNIQFGMDALMKDRTTLVIAHRLSTVRNSDKILVLENGSIIERGTHQQLLEMKGRYYQLASGIKELN